jgi:alkaline phosphatase D
MEPRARELYAENADLRWYNGERGYTRCELTPEALMVDYRVVPTVTAPGSDALTRASFVIENGKAGALGP